MRLESRHVRPAQFAAAIALAALGVALAWTVTTPGEAGALRNLEGLLRGDLSASGLSPVKHLATISGFSDSLRVYALDVRTPDLAARLRAVGFHEAFPAQAAFDAQVDRPGLAGVCATEGRSFERRFEHDDGRGWSTTLFARRTGDGRFRVLCLVVFVKPPGRTR